MKASAISGVVDEFVQLLRSLRKARQQRKTALRAERLRRQTLSAHERAEIFRKTDGRCHICGGAIDGAWQADHALAHSGGGEHRADNYLPAHVLCNNYRWDYSPKEFLHILKLGVWLRTQIERATPVGRLAAERYVAHEKVREGRRRGNSGD